MSPIWERPASPPMLQLVTTQTYLHRYTRSCANFILIVGGESYCKIRLCGWVLPFNTKFTSREGDLGSRGIKLV